MSNPPRRADGRGAASAAPLRVGGGDGPERPGRVLVTGATGLVGSHAAERLTRAGWRVRALVRPRSDTSFLEKLGTEMVVGDLTHPGSLRGAAEGCRAVLHAAALVAGPAEWERYREVNVEGTRKVLTEAIRAGCSRFLHVSSIAVYGFPGDHPSLPLDEDASVSGRLGPEDHYERSKRASEMLLRRAAPESLGWTVLRPAVIVGERDRLFTPRLARLADRRILVTVGDGRNRLPVVYAGNVAEACRIVLERPSAAGRVYNLASDGGITQRELLTLAAPPDATVLPLPRPLVRAVAGSAYRLHRLLPGRDAPLLSPRRVWFLSEPNPFSTERLRRELGWRPTVPTVEGWRRALHHLRRNPAARDDRASDGGVATARE